MLADFNGDEILDCATTTNLLETFTVYVFLNNRDGTFQAVLLERAGLVGPIALGDLDGNGTVDLAIDNSYGVGIYLNDGSGSGHFAKPFALDDPLAKGGAPLIVDLNGDGIVDIAYQGTASAAIFLGRGSGKFNPTPLFL